MAQMIELPKPQKTAIVTVDDEMQVCAFAVSDKTDDAAFEATNDGVEWFLRNGYQLTDMKPVGANMCFVFCE